MVDAWCLYKPSLLPVADEIIDPRGELNNAKILNKYNI